MSNQGAARSKARRRQAVAHSNHSLCICSTCSVGMHPVRTREGLLGRIASACSALMPLRALAEASSASIRRSSSACC